MKGVVLSMFVLFVVATVALSAVGVYAYRGYGYGMGVQRMWNEGFASGQPGDCRGMYNNHESMEEIFEDGTYADLLAYRQKTGLQVLPWVDSKEEFTLAKEMHERMEQQRQERVERSLKAMPCLRSG